MWYEIYCYKSISDSFIMHHMKILLSCVCKARTKIIISTPPIPDDDPFLLISGRGVSARTMISYLNTDIICFMQVLCPAIFVFILMCKELCRCNMCEINYVWLINNELCATYWKLWVINEKDGSESLCTNTKKQLVRFINGFITNNPQKKQSQCRRQAL